MDNWRVAPLLSLMMGINGVDTIDPAIDPAIDPVGWKSAAPSDIALPPHRIRYLKYVGIKINVGSRCALPTYIHIFNPSYALA